ncbi:MAG: hypothetical protein N3B16_02550 [Candidatus Aminicenantes bacterium]|nr:hypothetical protein [Candidatus Aminicenantes bacterium]
MKKTGAEMRGTKLNRKVNDKKKKTEPNLSKQFIQKDDSAR